MYLILMLTGLVEHPCSYIMSVNVQDLTNLNHYKCIYIIDKPLDITNRHYIIYVKSSTSIHFHMYTQQLALLYY